MPISSKRTELGGLLNQVCFVSHDNHNRPAGEIVAAKVAQVRAHPNIKVFTDTQIESVRRLYRQL